MPITERSKGAPRRGRPCSTSRCRCCCGLSPTNRRSACSSCPPSIARSPRRASPPQASLHGCSRIAKLPGSPVEVNAGADVASPYIERILKARVYDVAVESPLDPAARLSRRLGNTVLLKREDVQAVFSFKLRGAYNKIAHLSDDAAKRGVICASAGNHAQGVALAASKRGIPATIVMPETTPQIKVQAVQDLGGEAVLHGTDFDAAYEHAMVLTRERNLVFVHPFDDPDVIAGQGTVGMEVLR